MTGSAKSSLEDYNSNNNDGRSVCVTLHAFGGKCVLYVLQYCGVCMPSVSFLRIQVLRVMRIS